MTYDHYEEEWVYGVAEQALVCDAVEVLLSVSADALDDSDVEVVEVLVDSIYHICNTPHRFHLDTPHRIQDQTILSKIHIGCMSSILKLTSS